MPASPLQQGRTTDRDLYVVCSSGALLSTVRLDMTDE